MITPLTRGAHLLTREETRRSAASCNIALTAPSLLRHPGAMPVRDAKIPRGTLLLLH